MRSRDTGARVLRFQVEEKRRQVGQIEAMIEEFNRMIGGLRLEIEAEERSTGVDDPSNFRYSTLAKAARQRMGNLEISVQDLDGQLAAARRGLETAEKELAREEERQERDAAQRAAG